MFKIRNCFPSSITKVVRCPHDFAYISTALHIGIHVEQKFQELLDGHCRAAVLLQGSVQSASDSDVLRRQLQMVRMPLSPAIYIKKGMLNRHAKVVFEEIKNCPKGHFPPKPTH